MSDHYYLTVLSDGVADTWRKPIPDPFCYTTVRTKFNWRARLRILFGGEHRVEVSVVGDPAIERAVMQLDGDKLQAAYDEDGKRPSVAMGTYDPGPGAL